MSPNLAGILALISFCTGSILAVLCDMTGLQLVSIMMFMGACVLGAGLKIIGHDLREGFKQKPKDYAFACCGISAYIAILYVSLRLAPPFEINMLNYLWPILLAGFSTFFQKQRLRLSQICGLALGFLGMISIF